MNHQFTSVSARLYNTGSVGDCILLLFFKEKEVRFSLLIDCGGWNAPTPQITECVRDIGNLTDWHLNLLVVTHQHLDHVSGFNQAQALFDRMTVDQVWMSWIENEEDEIGQKLRDLYGKKVRALKSATSKALNVLNQQSRMNLNVRNFDIRLGMKKKAMQEAIDLLQFEEGILPGMRGAAARKTNDDAMKYVKKLSTKVCYRVPGEVIHSDSGTAGLKFFILGPPRDEDMRYFKIPMEDEEMYHLRNKKADTDVEPVEQVLSNGILVSGIVLEEGISPFEPRYHLSSSQKKAFFTAYDQKDTAWRQIETDWLESAAAIAMRVTSLTNNTSLAMAIQIESSGEVILLPADAQSGNWMGWHKKEVMEALKKNGGKDTKEILADTILYKVGHHGSHNGTASKSGLEWMKNKNLVAIIPLVQDKVPNGWGGAANFPAEPLYEKLIEKTRGRVIRVDEGIAKKGSAVRLRNTLSKAEKSRFAKSVEHTARYVEYSFRIKHLQTV